MEKGLYRNIRFGILGFGKIAKTRFLPAISLINSVHLAAIGTRNPNKIKGVSLLSKDSPLILTYEELVKEGKNIIDAVYIALPNDMHEEWILRCAEAGLHILCEKPLHYQENGALLCRERCREKGVLLAEAFMYRHDHRHQRVKKIVQSGELGRIHLLEASFSYFLEDLSNIRLSPERKGGALMDIGCYGIDLSRLILDDEPIEVTARCLRGELSGVDELISIILTFSTGTLCVITASTHLMRYHGYKIRCSHGTIHVPNAFIPHDEEDRHLTIEYPNGERQIERFPPFSVFQAEILHFANSLLSNDPDLLTPMEDGVCNAKILEAAICSMGEGLKVDLMKRDT